MHVAKWGNSLAIRIPADVVRALGLKEGDPVSLTPLGATGFGLAREEQREKAIAAIRSLRGTIPSGFKFDRDEVNER